jgi:hydroxymethylglutaryl-CoA lyase
VTTTTPPLPDHVSIREVGPRDGFQNEPELISTNDKVRLIDQLARPGIGRLEVTNFVCPDITAQFADGSQVLRRIDPPESVSISVHIRNERGLAQALADRAEMDEISV